MPYQIQADPFNALRCFQDCLFGAVLLLDRCLFLWGLVLEIAIKQCIQRIACDLGGCFPTFVEDLAGGTIGDCLLNRVSVYVPTELLGGLLSGDQWSAREGNLGGIGQSGVDGSTKGSVLSAVCLVCQHDDPI